MLRLFASTPVRNAAVTQARRMVATQSVQKSTNLDVPLLMNPQEEEPAAPVKQEAKPIGLDRDTALAIAAEKYYSTVPIDLRAYAVQQEWFRRTETLPSPLEMKEEEPAALVKQEAKPVSLDRDPAFAIAAENDYSTVPIDLRAYVVQKEWFRRTETLPSPLKMKEEEPAAPVKQEAKPVSLDRDPAFAIAAENNYSTVPIDLRAYVVQQEWFRRTETLPSLLKVKEEEPAAPVKQEAEPVGLDQDTALVIAAENDYSTVPIDLRAYVVQQEWFRRTEQN